MKKWLAIIVATLVLAVAVAGISGLYNKSKVTKNPDCVLDCGFGPTDYFHTQNYGFPNPYYVIEEVEIASKESPALAQLGTEKHIRPASFAIDVVFYAVPAFLIILLLYKLRERRAHHRH